MTFHEGEQAVQARAGVEAMARRIGRGIHSEIPFGAEEFLQEQTLAIAASLDADGHVWASPLTGMPGFLTVLDAHTVRVSAQPSDRLLDNLKVNPSLGLVAIDLSTRQRVRLHGSADVRPDGVYLAVQQAYANCQKYIQTRLSEPVESHATEVRSSNVLTGKQQQWIAKADTFFIASFHPTAGADASHRGGNPGFVRVLNSSTLEFPDYPGNFMFNTLGNLTANPNCGLLFLDFENGNLLQLTGQTDLIWDADHIANFPGAERTIKYHIAQVVEITNGLPLRFKFLEFSPFNMPVLK